MCIALISTAHPDYPLILVDNRDEFLRRPTAAADWWPEPYSFVLGSRDMARAAHGTWLGVTKHGRIAVLTNYKEDDCSQAIGKLSRGEIINSFLELPSDGSVNTEQFVDQLVAGGEAQLAGGFSLACGNIRGPLAIVSNRVCSKDSVTWIAKERGETVALSNVAFGDCSWKKVQNGESMMKEALHTSSKLGEHEDQLVQRLLAILSTDTLPRLKEGGDLETYIDLLRESIFIPVIGEEQEDERDEAEICTSKIHEKAEIVGNGQANHMQYMKGLYGTQKQTVVLVHNSGRVKFFERTLYDNDAKPIPIGEGDREFEFVVGE
ncbi:hypothetical protein LOZ39_006281 [Ophidiomyces ophidiicola]|nr:hypothetical protein LOZ64_005262 [Ophidiomyces ophidiicola]KAI1914898.1 hypothetical protein LOZ61_002035 [Ophidiomyces ophidiicola]KAI1924774.1 hypothetical protein LOZ60_004506 [Ophidiomyces ophidiicola]KAI1953203.1 hypothetical protein LOZ59_005245 [Ophidiomyces ophidiicola]KAI2009794.1 hypothetical protein LOZ49_003762 [Ophidiomyces ophidiicola]